MNCKYVAVVLILLLGGCLEDSAHSRQTGEAKPPVDSYREIIPWFWDEIYPAGGRTLYCGELFLGDHGNNINIEHVFPMSWVTKPLKCGDRDSCRRNSDRFNRIESDMHNMYPARRDVNKSRSAMPFGIVDGEKRLYPGCDFEIDFKRRNVEPRPEVRGQIARSMLYMVDAYPELRLYRRQRDLLEKWHEDYPPTREERERNNHIHRIQGNRNPYIER